MARYELINVEADRITTSVNTLVENLEAFLDLLRALPPTTGMAYVLVQHLEPTRESHLPEILSRATAMPVLQAQEDVQIDTLNRGSDQPNTITQRFFWKPVRMRVNRQQFSTDSVHLQIHVQRCCHYSAAVAAANFDDPLGLEVPHQAVCDLGIDRFKESVAPRVTCGTYGARGRSPFRLVARHNSAQKIELFFQSKINADRKLVGWPLPSLQLLEVGNRPVVVIWDETYADALKYTKSRPYDSNCGFGRPKSSGKAKKRRVSPRRRGGGAVGLDLNALYGLTTHGRLPLLRSWV